MQPLKRGVTEQIFGGGKRIRAALCVASCRLFDNDGIRSLDFAAAIEHVHSLTLVHDDIADGDSERRSRASIWRQYGVAHGINIGDVFISLASLSILRAAYPEPLKTGLLWLLSEYGLQMVEGQNLDICLREHEAATAADYFECTRKKTGALLAMATVGGGMIGGASEMDLHRLREFAFRAGIAFQIKDDLLDITGGKGRARGSDIREGKRTLMAIGAAEVASDGDRKLLFEILDKPREVTSLEDIEWVCDLYRDTGAVRRAERTATNLINEASDHLLALPESEAKYLMLSLARYISTRHH